MFEEGYINDIDGIIMVEVSKVESRLREYRMFMQVHLQLLQVVNIQSAVLIDIAFNGSIIIERQMESISFCSSNGIGSGNMEIKLTDTGCEFGAGGFGCRNLYRYHAEYDDCTDSVQLRLPLYLQSEEAGFHRPAGFL